MNFVDLYRLLEERKETLPEGSGTTKLIQKGLIGILPKLNEESFEIGLALEHEGAEDVALEVSQCFYYCILLAVVNGDAIESINLEPTSAADYSDAHELAKQLARKSALICHQPTIDRINDLTPLLFNALNQKNIALDTMFQKL